jgi:hypothetical protein
VYDRKDGMLLAGLVLLIVAGHPETVLHVVAIGVIYGAFELLRTRAWRAIPRAIAAGGVALLLTAIYLLPFAEAAPLTLEHEIRTQLYAPTPYANIIKPEARMHRIRQTFAWRREGDPLSTRVGYAALTLACVALVARRRPITWFFLGLAAAGFLITCGIWPLPHLLHAVPLFDIALNERLAFGASFALAMLAALGADTLARARAVPAILLAAVLIERAFEDGSTYPSLPVEMFYPRVPEIASIPKNDGRIAGVNTTLVPNGAAMYELEDVRGYETMTFRRLVDTYPLWARYQGWFNIVDDPTRPFLSFLNVRWILDETRVTENRNALPRAFVPPVIRYERDGESVLRGMGEATDFARRAWIESTAYEPHDSSNGPGTITTRRVGLGLQLDASMEREGWVVISETAWPGWRASVDGRPIPTYFANHAFLGIHVPAGRHRIRLVYRPESFTRGRAISLIALAGLIAFTIARACLRLRSTSPSPPS